MNDFAKEVINSKINKTYIFSVGQAGFIIKSKSGKLLGIDLYLSDCVERIEKNIEFKRLLPKILYPFELDFDVIIATHLHYDHFDMDSIPELISNKKTRLYVSKRCREEIDNLKISDYNPISNNITYVKPDEKYFSTDFEMEFVKCDHGDAAPDAVGVIITVDNKKIYIAGDTCLRMDRVEYFSKKGNIDVMIAPINGAYGNMNENECAEFANALSPKYLIPCHYGMFRAHGGSIEKFANIMNEKYKKNKYIILEQGDKIEI